MVYLKAAIQEFSLKSPFYFIYTWRIQVVGSISSKTAGTTSVVLVGVGSFVSVFQLFFIYLLSELLVFWELPLVAG